MTRGRRGPRDTVAALDLDDPLLNLATVLTAGIVGGELIAKLKLPKVTGWIATGIVLRMLMLPGLTPDQLGRFSPFTNFVLGYIAFTVGAALYLASLRNTGTRLGLLLLGEAVVTPAVVAALMIYVGGTDTSVGLLLAAIAIAGAPGTTVLVIREARARGILTRTLIAAVGLIDVVAVGAFVFLHAFCTGSDVTWDHALIAVGEELGVAFALGLASALVTIGLVRTIVSPAFLGPLMVVLILGAWGEAQALGVSSILACTFAGICLSNLRHETVRAGEAYLRDVGGVLFAGFYTLAGMRLNFSLVLPMLGLVVLYFLARLVGKWLGSAVAMQAAGTTASVRNYLGLALLPHGGVAVGLIIMVQSDPALTGVADEIATVGLAALALNQLLGPSATRFSLRQAQEIGKDRPRLLDFLTEDRIVVGLGGTKEDVIRRLATQLYATTSMPIEQQAFVDKVLTREREESTCLGHGIMIPHTSLEEGDSVRGVLGICPQGLNFDASDGRAVHAVLLLATPTADRQRHLEILSAFAAAITRNESLAEQLYHARSPAHACEVIHADEAAELNYFLDEAIEFASAQKR